MTWQRPDGTPLDPWIRVHTGLGGRILKAAPRSLNITGSVSEWESWTQMAFPDSGEYVIPQGLATVPIDRGPMRAPTSTVVDTSNRTSGCSTPCDVREKVVLAPPHQDSYIHPVSRWRFVTASEGVDVWVHS